MSKVRVAIAGVGNCATSLVQGVEFYRDADVKEKIPGLMHTQLGDYHVGDVEFVAAFDVDAAKVGTDLADALDASLNCTIRIAEVPPTGVTVQRGPTLDGLGMHYQESIGNPPNSQSTSPKHCVMPTSTSWCLIFLWVPKKPISSMPKLLSTLVVPSSTRCLSSSLPTPSGHRNLQTRVCQSSAMTSNRRWAQQSPTA